MSSLLQELENNEAVLVMYLHGELPPEDHAEVEQLLRADASLARELERLRQVHADCLEALAALDEAQRLRSEPAARQALRALRKWNLLRHALVEPQPRIQEVSRRWWLTYPASAAAVILVGLTLWWTYFAPPSGSERLVIDAPYPTGVAFFESWESEYLVLAEQQSLILSRLDLEEPLFPFMELLPEEATH